MAKKLTKVNRVSIGKKNVLKVSEIFGCNPSLVYRALKGGTSETCLKIRQHVEENKNEYGARLTAEWIEM